MMNKTDIWKSGTIVHFENIKLKNIIKDLKKQDKNLYIRYSNFNTKLYLSHYQHDLSNDNDPNKITSMKSLNYLKIRDVIKILTEYMDKYGEDIYITHNYEDIYKSRRNSETPHTIFLSNVKG